MKLQSITHCVSLNIPDARYPLLLAKVAEVSFVISLAIDMNEPL